MGSHPILINGSWQAANASSTFQSANPKTKEKIADEYPVSSWQDCDAALAAATEAAAAMRQLSAEKIAEFLECFADKIEENKDALVEMAHQETGRAVS